MTVQTSLSLLKDNATSCNPALPSGHGQCNVLQSSPTSGFFSLSLFYSTSLYRTQISSFFYVLAQTQIHDNSKPKCTQQHFKPIRAYARLQPSSPSLHLSIFLSLSLSLSLSLNLCNTCNPVQSEMSTCNQCNTQSPRCPQQKDFSTTLFRHIQTVPTILQLPTVKLQLPFADT